MCGEFFVGARFAPSHTPRFARRRGAPQPMRQTSPRPRRRARPMRAPPAVPAAAPIGGSPSFLPLPCGVNNCA